MADEELLTFDGLVLNDATFGLRELSAPPPRERGEWIAAADSEFAALVRTPRHENREITVRINILPQASRDDALDRIGELVDKCVKASKYPDGIELTWTPSTSGRTVTFDVLSAEIVDMPIDDEHGWTLALAPSLTVVMKAKPYWRGTTVEVGSSAILWTNEVVNPSFEADAINAAPASWSNSGGLAATTFRVEAGFAAEGTQSLRVTTPASASAAQASGAITPTGTNGYALAAGDVVALRAAIKVQTAMGGTYRMRPRFYNAAGTLLTIPTAVALPGTAAVKDFPPATWTAPANTAHCAMEVYGETSAGGQVIDFYLDAALLVINPVAATDIKWTADAEHTLFEEFANWIGEEVARFTRVASPCAQGDFAWRVQLVNGDDAMATTEDGAQTGPFGERSELAISNPRASRAAWDTTDNMSAHRLFYEDVEEWHAWQVYIPDDFPVDANSWQVITQWKHEGSLGAADIGTGPAIEMVLWNNLLRLAVAPGPGVNGGTPGPDWATDRWSTVPVTGRWIKFTLNVLWNPDPVVGRVQLWSDIGGNGMEEVLAQTFGSTMRENDDTGIAPPSHLRMGIYRDPALSGDATIYFDGFTVATTRAAAEANAFGPGQYPLGTSSRVEPPYFDGSTG